MRHTTQKAFTIVEMLIVIVVIGILVGLAAVGWGGWQGSLSKKQLESDLKQASISMENAKNFGSGYPSSLPTTFKPGQGVTLTYVTGTDTIYCIEAYKTSNPSVKYYINQQSAKAILGSCGGTSIAAPTISNVVVSGNFFNIYWNDVSGAASYDVESRPNSSGTWTHLVTQTGPDLEEYFEFDSPNTAQVRIRSSTVGAVKSVWSETVTITRIGEPSAITYCATGDGQLSYSWTVPGSTPLTDFYFTWSTSQGGGQYTHHETVDPGVYNVQGVGEYNQGDEFVSFYGVSADGRTATMPQSAAITGNNYPGSCYGE